MKISIYADDFKSITERAVTAAAKKSSNFLMESILIEAYGGKIVAKAYDLDHYAEVITDAADVIDEGAIVVHRDNLKSLYNMKGRITLESADKIGIVKSAKKTSRFCVCDKPEDFTMPTIGKTQHAFTIKQSELLETMTKIKPYLAKEYSNPILKGIHIIGTKEYGTFYGCSGYFAIRQTVKGKFDTFAITVPEVSKDIKDVSGEKNNKQNCDIVVSYGEKYVVYEGKDFKFATRLIEGKYVDIKKIFSGTFTDSFDLDASELCKLAKEYKDILIHKTTTSKTVMPMFFTNNNGSLSAIALGSNFQTMDNLETVDNSTIFADREYAQGFNPEYMELVTKTFGKETIHIDIRTGVWKMNGKSDCSILLVPMRTTPKDKEKIHSFIQSVA